MPKKRTTLYFDYDQKQKVIAIAAQQGRYSSFTAIIEEALDLWVRCQAVKERAKEEIEYWAELDECDVDNCDQMAISLEWIFPRDES